MSWTNIMQMEQKDIDRKIKEVHDDDTEEESE